MGRSLYATLPLLQLALHGASVGLTSPRSPQCCTKWEVRRLMKRNSSFGESKLINLRGSRLPSGREGAVVVGGG